MWLSHWGLTHDPFAAAASPYVSLSSHDEAVALLGYAVETGEPEVMICGSRGIGKTTVLRRAIAQVRGPSRRIVVVSEPPDDAVLLGRLAEGLGTHVGDEPTPGRAWKALERAVRARCLEGLQVVLAIEDCRRFAESPLRGLIGFWRAFAGNRRGVTVVEVVGDNLDHFAAAEFRRALHAVLKPMTRSETEEYLRQKLAAAGSRVSVFTSRAITRAHALCAGVPRGVERLATLSLIAGASRGVDQISAEIIEGVASACNDTGCMECAPPAVQRNGIA
jgi:type II secretory pathway predicted ATPase ExeA